MIFAPIRFLATYSMNIKNKYNVNKVRPILENIVNEVVQSVLFSPFVVFIQKKPESLLLLSYYLINISPNPMYY